MSSPLQRQRAVREDAQTRDALAFMENAYSRRLRRPRRTVEHPLEVAGWLAEDGQPTEVVLAGLLHDVLEDTYVTVGEVAERFGPRVAGLVAALTQDESLVKYKARKRRLRLQTLAAGREAATVAIADKLAKVDGTLDRPRPRRLRHYRATLAGFDDAFGPSRLSARLRERLDRWPDD
jgi:(p)ppGpp synthase/HD superfamily hydrolase